MFELCDKVKWTSQAGGRTKEKNGTVVMVVHKGMRPPYVLANQNFPDHRRMFDGTGIPGGYRVGYLVEVRDGKTKKAMPKLYMPYPNNLVLVE